MINYYDESWEIQDDKGVIFRGNEDEMRYAWNVNCLTNEYYSEIYGTSSRNQKYIINEWYGILRLVHIIQNLEFGEYGNHTQEELKSNQ